MLSLFVYSITTEMFGKEWFVDLATPFGWTPSEWGWQCVLGIILWHFLCCGLEDIFAFVDNFFFLTHPSAHTGAGGYAAVFSRIEAEFARLHIPLHERMCGTRFSGLGWEWDTSPTDGPPLMICADDKFVHLCRQLPVWAGSQSLPFRELEHVIGFLQWIAVGFPIGRSHLAHLRAQLKAHRSSEGRRLLARGVQEE